MLVSCCTFLHQSATVLTEELSYNEAEMRGFFVVVFFSWNCKFWPKKSRQLLIELSLYTRRPALSFVVTIGKNWSLKCWKAKTLSPSRYGWNRQSPLQDKSEVSSINLAVNPPDRERNSIFLLLLSRTSEYAVPTFCEVLSPWPGSTAGRVHQVGEVKFYLGICFGSCLHGRSFTIFQGFGFLFRNLSIIIRKINNIFITLVLPNSYIT